MTWLTRPPYGPRPCVHQRHRKGFKKLNLPADQRKALLRGLTTQVGHGVRYVLGVLEEAMLSVTSLESPYAALDGYTLAFKILDEIIASNPITSIRPNV